MEIRTKVFFYLLYVFFRFSNTILSHAFMHLSYPYLSFTHSNWWCRNLCRAYIW